MQRDAQRHSRQTVADRIGEDYVRKGRRRLAVIAACRKTPQPPDALPQRDGRRINVKDFQSRKAIQSRIPDSKKDGGDETAVKNSAGLKCCPGEKFAGTVAVKFPIR